MRRPVLLDSTVLDAVDRRRGARSRAEFIAEAVALLVDRKAAGGGVLVGEPGDRARFMPEGLLESLGYDAVSRLGPTPFRSAEDELAWFASLDAEEGLGPVGLEALEVLRAKQAEIREESRARRGDHIG